MLSRIFCDSLYLFPLFRIGVTKCFKTVAFVNRECYSSCNFYPFCFEKLFGRFDSFLINRNSITMSFKIDLVYPYLPGNLIPYLFKPLHTVHFLYLIRTDIHCNFKIFITNKGKGRHCNNSKKCYNQKMFFHN